MPLIGTYVGTSFQAEHQILPSETALCVHTICLVSSSTPAYGRGR